MAKPMGLRRRGRGEGLGAKAAKPKPAAQPELPWKVRLSVWGGVVLSVASFALFMSAWEMWEPDPLRLGGAAVAVILGVWLVTYYFTKAGELK